MRKQYGKPHWSCRNRARGIRLQCVGSLIRVHLWTLTRSDRDFRGFLGSSSMISLFEHEEAFRVGVR